MRRGFFSIPGLIFVFIAAILYFALYPFFSSIINGVLPMVDPFTQLVLSMIMPAIPIALLKGYYDSIVNPLGDYRG